LTVGVSPSITLQPQSREVAEGANVTLTVSAAGTGPLNFQWFLNGTALAQATGSALNLTNVQFTNAASYTVSVSSPFGAVVSSNAILTVDLPPVIAIQPQSQTVVAGTNVTFSVTVAGSALPSLPSVSSGTLQLWLKADADVATNASGQVSQWADQSGNANDAIQSNANNQPLLAYPPGIGGRAAVRFNGIQDNVNGDYLAGAGDVGLSGAMTAFAVYNAFTTVPSTNTIWLIGVPGQVSGASRGEAILNGQLDFTAWNDDASVPWAVPTNTCRIWTDRVNTNMSTVDIFDTSAAGVTNFSEAMAGMVTPAAGYYVGGLDPSLPNVSGNNFCGDVAELICYSGYLSESDRLAVQAYLQQKYFLVGVTNGVSFQWQFDGANIAGATNTTFTLTNVQAASAGVYTVVVSNGVASTTSSNAVLTINVPPVILTQPRSLTIMTPADATLTVTASGEPMPAFQWQVNGVNVPGRTGACLTISNALPADGGSYSVIASNCAGSIVSSNAILTVGYFTETAEGQPQQVPTAILTSPSTVQPGNTFTVSAVDPASLQGGSLQLGNDSIIYTPPAAFEGMDSFAYVLTPASGAVIRETVTVLVDAPTGNGSFVMGVTAGGGQTTIQFAGIPGVTYSIESSTGLTNWTVIGSVTVGPNGLFQFQDAGASQCQQCYYRTSFP